METKKACPNCWQSEMVIKNGKDSKENQKLKCKTCNVNYIDNWQDTDNTEIESKSLSDNPKQVNFRAKYNNKFTVPRYSEKYDFEFSSWKEYYSKRAKIIPKKQKKWDIQK